MDKFNDIWKNRFNEGDVPVGDWNTPDPEVWDAIYPHVSKGKNNRKGIFWWLGLGLILIMIAGYFLISKAYISSHTGVNIDNDVNRQLVFNVDNSLVKKETFAPVKLVTEIQSSKENQHKVNYKELINHNEISEEIEFVGTNFRGIHSDTEREGIILKNGETNLTIVLGKEDIENPVLTNFNSYSAFSTDFLPSLILPPVSENGIDLHFDEKLIQNEMPESDKFKFNLESGAVFWQHQISSSYTSDLAPFDFNYSNDVGWILGTSVDYKLSNYLSVFSGVYYERVETSSGHNSELEYHLNNELETTANDYNLSLATPYGLSGASFRLERNEMLAEEETELLVDFQSQHLIQNFSVPVGLKVYPMGQRQRFVPSATVGLGLNYLHKISNNIHSINTHHDAIEYKKTGDADFASPDLNNFHLDLRLGFGLDYHLTKDVQIGLNFNWAKGLNPVFKQENYNTSINRYQLAIGLKKSF